ncbi:MAG: AzlC family ABC transporter permease [Spirochaetales bacterium]|nr:AzlC family ABC transporter permease [Spirochaetales bacterium]
MKLHRQTIAHAFSASIPVLIGYLAIGFAFGFLLVKAGFSWAWAPVMSICIYAGAGQYLAVGLLSEQKGLFELGLAIFLVNLRHMVYGFSLLERFSHYGRSKLYMIFGLTDETYALLTTVHPKEGDNPEQFDFFITLFNHSYWVLGGLIGAIFGSLIPWNAQGIEFALTALFTVLLIEQIKSLKRPEPFVIAAAVILILRIIGIGKYELLAGILISSLACFFIKKEKIYA